MSALSIRLPDSIHNRAKELAKKENISINQLLASALIEKISALDTEDYLAQRAKKGSEAKFLKALKKTPSAAPELQDQLD
jgi:predicted transcriptional regulator